MIARDGYQTSLWQSSIPPYQPVNISDNSNYDVIIVGGGITGISTALLLQESGKKCLVLEANTLCFGTTGGTTAHLNTLLDTPYSTIRKKFNAESAAIVAKSTEAAIELVKRNIKKYSIDCDFSEADAFLFAENSKQEKQLEEIAEAALEAGLDLQFTENIPVPASFVSAIRVKGQAKFHPLKYVYGLAKAFERRGGHIRQDCRVTGVEVNEKVEVTTSSGQYACADLIYATHIPPGVNLLHLRCSPYRSYVMAVVLDKEEYPADLCYDMVDPYHYYRTQEVDGQLYLIAGGKDHKTGHEENTQHRFTELEAHIRKMFRVKKVAYKWSSQYYESADGLPYIGHLPGQPEHLYVATGFGGNGMVYSSVAALTLEAILNNEENGQTRLFDPNRLKPVAGFTNFIQQNAGVAGELLGRLFSGEHLEELAELAPGEGKMVSYEGQKIALYKDEEGVLHAIDPVCTHLKCEVNWNSAERSWDCPCHGTRYNYDGRVLTGPADRDAEPIYMESLAEH
ncbi:MAG TPA: FAD-dependent oxidoreductase [Chitinophagaceae bacterium]|nr:FAD-dependent oxidoreductase [Chitinophagaceae bacterium]